MNIDGIDALIGLILPALVGFITTQKLTQPWKDFAAGICIVLAALVRCFVSGSLDFSSLGTSITTIGVVYTSSYMLFNKYVVAKMEQTGPITDPKPLVPVVTEPTHPDNPGAAK